MESKVSYWPIGMLLRLLKICAKWYSGNSEMNPLVLFSKIHSSNYGVCCPVIEPKADKCPCVRLYARHPLAWSDCKPEISFSAFLCVSLSATSSHFMLLLFLSSRLISSPLSPVVHCFLFAFSSKKKKKQLWPVLTGAPSHQDVWRSGGISPPFLTCVLDGCELSASRPGRVVPREIAPGTNCMGGGCAPESVSALWSRETFLTTGRNRTRAVHLIVCCYTDWAIPTPRLYCTVLFCRFLLCSYPISSALLSPHFLFPFPLTSHLSS